MCGVLSRTTQLNLPVTSTSKHDLASVRREPDGAEDGERIAINGRWSGSYGSSGSLDVILSETGSPGEAPVG